MSAHEWREGYDVGRLTPIWLPEDHMPRILEMISRGVLMIDIIKMEGMPSWCVINGWLQDPDWQVQYARARMQMAHVVAETAIKEATENNTDDPQRARLKFDARRWYVGKIAPRVYGDKVQHQVEVGESYVEALRVASQRINQRIKEEKQRNQIVDVDPETGDITQKIGNDAVTSKPKKRTKSKG
jgi:hypothetical protein